MTPNMTPATRRRLLWLATQPGFEGLREPCEHKDAFWIDTSFEKARCPCGAEWISNRGANWTGEGYVLPSAPECLWRLVPLLQARGFEVLIAYEPNEAGDVGASATVSRDIENYWSSGWWAGYTMLDAIALATVRALGGPE